MRVSIVTFYNSCNCGAFLQAFALSHFIEENCGTTPSFVDIGARSITSDYWRQLKNAIKHFNIRKIRFINRKFQGYRKAIDNFEVITRDEANANSDIVVFGSDEIWNVSRKEISDYPALWGDGFESPRKVSYAPSCNGAQFKLSDDFTSLVNNIKTFSHLSARDEFTAEQVADASSMPVSVVCDPTLLYDDSFYAKYEVDPKLRNYILVYSSGTEMSQEEVTQIVQFAKGKNLKLFAVGHYLSWCDECFPSDPFEFLGFYRHASYVVTDTFHGTAFSVIYRKRFISFARGKSKINELLNECNLQERNPGFEKPIKGVLEGSIDWSRAQIQLTSLCKNSRVYIDLALNDRTENLPSTIFPKTLVEEVNIPLDNNGSAIPQSTSNANLAKMTTIKIGGVAKKLYVPRKGDDLALLPRENNRYLILSRGSNVLINDQHEYSSVISMKEYDDKISFYGNGIFRVGASVGIQAFISFVNAQDYGGIEELVSIPGLLGGLICMNASVPSAKVSISDYLVSVDVYTEGGIKRFYREECAFSYRDSLFKQGDKIILSAVFCFPKTIRESSQYRIWKRKNDCKKKQDHSNPNFGSVFKVSSPRIMRTVKRFGVNSGDCYFSRKTTNWLLSNEGTYGQAIEAIERVEKIHHLFGQSCEREVVVWD